MKRSELSKAIRDCQKIVASWSQEKRDSVRLEGTDIYLERYRQNQEQELQSTEKHKEKRK